MKPTHTLPALLLSLVLHGIGPRLLGAEALAPASPPRKADLVIVGTGISGLAAALDAGDVAATDAVMLDGLGVPLAVPGAAVDDVALGWDVGAHGLIPWARSMALVNATALTVGLVISYGPDS